MCLSSHALDDDTTRVHATEHRTDEWCFVREKGRGNVALGMVLATSVEIREDPTYWSLSQQCIRPASLEYKQLSDTGHAGVVTTFTF